MENTKTFSTFAEFYPYYLGEHSNSTCRRLHFVGTSLVILIFVMALVVGNGAWLLALPVAGYGFAWVGHFFFEKTARPPSSIRSTACWGISSCTATCAWARSRSELKPARRP